MKHLLIAAAALALSTGAAAQEGRGQGGRDEARRNSYANPSAVIAAELAFAQAAQVKGQWTAFAESATPDAVMFTPRMVYAQGWLRGRVNPAVAVKWQPHEVWSSCDGSLVVSHGAWQSAKATGYFTTLWQRQKDGKYKWILDHGDDVKVALAAPEMLAAHVADCPARALAFARGGKPPLKLAAAKSKAALPPLNPAKRGGKSDDGTLSWAVTAEPDGARNLSVDWTKDGAITPVLIEQVAAPAKS